LIDERITSVSFDSENLFLAIGTEEANIKLVNIKTNSVERKFDKVHKKPCLVQFESNTRNIVSCSEDGTFKIWDPDF